MIRDILELVLVISSTISLFIAIALFVGTI